MIDSLADTMAGSKRRKSHGYWIPFAWASRSLIDRGFGVTESVRQVLVQAGEEASRGNVASVRATYYTIKDSPWPAAVETNEGTTAEPDEGFEV
jgi:hypothetical protein